MSPGRHTLSSAAVVFALAVTAVPAAATEPMVTTPYSGPSFTAVSKLCFDAAGNMYVTQRAPVNAVLKIPAGGGTPEVFATGFNDPIGIVCDSQGNVFVCNYAVAGRVDKVTPGGTRTVFATGIALPQPIAIDASDNLYVGENITQAVKKITPAGVVTQYAQAGLGIGGNGENRRLDALFLSPAGNLLCGTRGPGDGTGPFPITSIPAGGGSRSVLGNSSIPVTDFTLGPDGYHYFAGYHHEVVARSVLPTLPGVYAGAINTPGLVDGPLLTARFGLPTGVKFGPDGKLYITDSTNDAIRTVDVAAPAERSTWGRLKGIYRH